MAGPSAAGRSSTSAGRGEVRVVLAEDNNLLRGGISALLRSTSNIDLVATADDLPSLYAAVEATTPDVLVTDIRMPPHQQDEGLLAAARYRDERPAMGIVVLSQHVSPSFAVRLLGDGTTARAYLLKDRVSDVGQLSSAIRRVADGGSVVDPLVVNQLMAEQGGASTSPSGNLTEREQEVLELVAAGKLNRSIADELFLSERTVEKHISSIFTKLEIAEDADMNRRVCAVVQYLSQGRSN